MMKILQNNKTEKVIDSFLNELKNAQEYVLSAAFITVEALQILKPSLLELDEKGIVGKILTGTMNGFNDKQVFDELLKLSKILSNFQIKVISTEKFHSKFYVFKKKDEKWSLIHGSSNLTVSALKSNVEFNTLIPELETTDVLSYFNDLFDEADELSQQFIDRLPKKVEINSVATVNEPKVPYITTRITPTELQNEALAEIERSRELGQKKGLLISATGTGKTMISAFDVARVKPKRLLFIAHRERLLQQAKSSFQKLIFDKSMGIFSGLSSDFREEYVFATVQTLSLHLDYFEKNTFDYIIIDESHRIGGETYQKILNYFETDWLIGMTATPERMDEYDVFEAFHHNVVYEIRLKDALDKGMLAPFHYFGVAEKLEDQASDIENLTSDSRVSYILDKIKYYHPKSREHKGLVFCSSVEEANQLAILFSKQDFPSRALSGSTPEREREFAISQLENDQLKFIFTRDLFNEGIDIPSVNEIVMLRQTESSIIFIQQLGRGLRKFPGKESVTILDFIGNYTNNYMIPMALTGEKSGNKENLRKSIEQIGTNFDVQFEEVAKERVFESIRSAQINSAKYLKDQYHYLKARLGKIPTLTNFEEYSEADSFQVARYKRSYPEFIEWVSKGEIKTNLAEWELKVLHFLTIEILPGKRLAEISVLQNLIEPNIKRAELPENLLKSAVKVLSLEFFGQQKKESYGQKALVGWKNSKPCLTREFSASLQSNQFKKLVLDLLETAILKNEKLDLPNELNIGQNYNYTEVCKLLLWDKDESATIGGYRTKNGSTPIFVNLDKNDEAIQYDDKFLSQNIFHWHSRRNRKKSSPELQPILNGEMNHLFVKKKDADNSTGFYYLGIAEYINNSAQEELLGDAPIVAFDFGLQKSVDRELYQYLIA